MAKYELMYIVDGSLDEEANQAVHDKVKSIVESNSTIVDTDHIGRKRFAYEINHQNEGDYMVLQLEAEANAPEILTSELRITEGVVRHLIVSVDE